MQNPHPKFVGQLVIDSSASLQLKLPVSKPSGFSHFLTDAVLCAQLAIGREQCIAIVFLSPQVLPEIVQKWLVPRLKLVFFNFALARS
jgi:hypothetical protein